jgi:myo-inositol-1(or 4)-monophosphatase
MSDRILDGGAAAGMPGPDWEAAELLAVELATLAGAEITTALNRDLTVSYKGAPGSFRDPVSEVDRKVEVLIRARLSERFPSHDILGEEMIERPGSGNDVVWAIDPVDGTSNFVNGFPLFSASIGVLYRGQPVVGALWCSTSHALRPGVYHARSGSPLRFDAQPVVRVPNPMVHRRLGGDPSASTRGLPWDIRKTGSAAIECAFVAAGLLQVARFAQPNIWDIAGGIVLARAAGREVMVHDGHRWKQFASFAEDGPRPARAPTPAQGGVQAALPEVVRVLREWHRPLILGEPDAVAHACELFA